MSRRYTIAVLRASILNAAKKKGGWEGIVAIPFESKKGKCITPCPYKEKTPTQKLSGFMREIDPNFPGRDDDCAKVGSHGCECCWYNCGHDSENGNVLFCGKEAGLTTISEESEAKMAIIHDLKTPRKI